MPTPLMLLTCLALPLAHACSPHGPPADPRAEAKEIADDYLKSRSLYDARRQVSVRDETTEWVVVYHVPEGYAGGGLQVGVDKQTKTVTGFVGSQ